MFVSKQEPSGVTQVAGINICFIIKQLVFFDQTYSGSPSSIEIVSTVWIFSASVKIFLRCSTVNVPLDLMLPQTKQWSHFRLDL